MSDDDRFEGLAEHVVRHLGPATKRWDPPGDDPGYGVTLHYPEKRPLPVVSAVTNGLRFQPIRAPKPSELLCTLQTGQEQEALHLVDGAAQYLLRQDPSPLAVHGHLVAGDDPLVPETNVRGLLFAVSPVFPDVSVFLGPDGEPAVQYLALLPLTGSDLQFLTEDDKGHDRQDRLWERWRANKAEFWDIRRPD
ncbi:hypothetical protein DVA86_34290 [Streptomyces armeniacus]|uniref:Suppressor of fused-like domain-containing protein n=1 Tax=Streptomyces armeniacus TaxID=83291 RepID=A0A345XYY9_9ACTN|nr:suppressor of fused domain protein [Streptomyces armeniacus]AXK36855.1 hypothetical protein DVA86_34290 [Streptomyces armeniacus]